MKGLLLSILACLGQDVLSRASDWEEDGSAKRSTTKNEHVVKPQSKFVLRGQVEHSDKLPALKEGLQAGRTYNPGAQDAKYASSWFKIPDWFSGTFRAEESTIDYVRDYATGKVLRNKQTVASRAMEVHGHQKDARGGIWHHYIKSGSSASEQASQKTYSNIDWYGPEYVGNDKVVIRFLATSLLVDKVSGVIVDSFRREDIKTYEPLGSGDIKVTYTSKSFDSRGNPRDFQRGTSVHKLFARFEPVDFDSERNYARLFRDFLSAEQMHELLPK